MYLPVLFLILKTFSLKEVVVMWVFQHMDMSKLNLVSAKPRIKETLFLTHMEIKCSSLVVNIICFHY